MTGRLVGVEEELLLVDPRTGRSVALSEQALRTRPGDDAPEATGSGSSPTTPDAEPLVEQEIYLQQVETANAPAGHASELREAIVAGRRAAGEAARAVGAAAVAVAVPVLDRPEGDVAPKPRYEEIVDSFGELVREVVACGMHTHVEVADKDEAVAVIDRLRPWLPVLLALSCNSPFTAGRLTGYESWRCQLWRRWPTSGAVEPFGTAADYDAAVEALIATEAARDRGMLYLDARPSESYSTVEVRIADVCTEVDDAVLVALLTRALVETASREAQSGTPLPEWRVDLLTAATWRASRDGLGGRLVDPASRGLTAATAVTAALLDHVTQALEDSGDLEEARRLLGRLTQEGTGAARQRSVFSASGDPAAVVSDLVERTEASWA